MSNVTTSIPIYLTTNLTTNLTTIIHFLSASQYYHFQVLPDKAVVAEGITQRYYASIIEDYIYN